MTFYNVIANYKHYVSHLSIEHDLFVCYIIYWEVHKITIWASNIFFGFFFTQKLPSYIK